MSVPASTDSISSIPSASAPSASSMAATLRNRAQRNSPGVAGVPTAPRRDSTLSPKPCCALS